MTAGVLELTDADFAAEVLGSPTAVLVKFWAQWCPPCKALDPVIQKLASENHPYLRIVSLNSDDYPELSASYGVLGLPVMKVFRDGRVVKSILGAKPEAALRADLAAFL